MSVMVIRKPRALRRGVGMLVVLTVATLVAVVGSSLLIDSFVTTGYVRMPFFPYAMSLLFIAVWCVAMSTASAYGSYVKRIPFSCKAWVKTDWQTTLKPSLIIGLLAAAVMGVTSRLLAASGVI